MIKSQIANFLGKKTRSVVPCNRLSPISLLFHRQQNEHVSSLPQPHLEIHEYIGNAGLTSGNEMHPR